jgi:hypothetical protein
MSLKTKTVEQNLVGKKSLQILTESVNGLKESWETEER